MVGALGTLAGMIPRDVVLIGVPTNSSGTADGVARAPAVLRGRGLTAALAGRPGFTDAGDLALPAPQPRRGPSGLLAEDALIVMIGQVRGAVRAAREDGRFPLLIGGDCPVILGALAALQAEAREPGLLFVDGHEDAWPPRVSPTGEAADCELGLALRMFDGALGPRLRAVLPAPWWLHTDLDVLATTELAAVDYPQPGGLPWRQLGQLTSAALATPGCAGWSVCIYNPDLDPGRGGADAIISYLTGAITAAGRR